MRIILNDQRPGECDILGLRAAKWAMDQNLPPGSISGVGFEDGSYYGLRINKDSVSVWPQRKDHANAD